MTELLKLYFGYFIKFIITKFKNILTGFQLNTECQKLPFIPDQANVSKIDLTPKTGYYHC